MNRQRYKEVREKWDGIVHGTKDDQGRDNCAFCEKYCNESKEEENCEGCPIYIKTGEQYCDGTPYEAWNEHHEDIHNNPEINEIECSECLRLAWDFFEFIKSLEKEIT